MTDPDFAAWWHQNVLTLQPILQKTFRDITEQAYVAGGMPNPDFGAWWFANILTLQPILQNTFRSTTEQGYVAGKKKGKDTEPPPDPTDDPADFSTGQSSLGVPGRDEET